MESVCPWGPLISLCNAACSVQRRFVCYNLQAYVYYIGASLKRLLLPHQQAKVLTSTETSKSLEPCLGNNFS